MIQIEKATRHSKKARIALFGISGSGKTFGALTIATGIGGKILFIDTESRSHEHFTSQFSFDVINFDPPYEVEHYLEAIKAGEDGGYSTIIIDSLSHAWAGEGGLLDRHSKITEASRSKNSYVAWREVTPLHNRLVESILHSACHIIVCMRAKMEYVQTPEGKVEKVGMGAIQRDGLEYEFDAVLELANPSHLASSSKDRTGLFDGKTPQKIDGKTGTLIAEYFSGGKPMPEPNPAPAPKPAPEPAPVASEPAPEQPTEPPAEKSTLEKRRAKMHAMMKELGFNSKEVKTALLNKITNKEHTGDLTDGEWDNLFTELQAEIDKMKGVKSNA